MSRWTFVLRRLTLAAGLLAVAAAAHAQKPTVLIHGFASNQGTWDVAQARITSDFSASIHRRSTNWNDSYEDQAGQVNDSFGGLPSSTVAIGHSNGGIIARQWSQGRALDGVVTIGTPHHGVPLLANWYFVYLKSSAIVSSVWDVIGGVQNCWDCNYGSWQWIFYDVLDIGDYVTAWLWQVTTLILTPVAS